MSNGETSLVRIPGWAWSGLVLLALGACVTVIASWVGGELTLARETNATQSTVLVDHAGRISRLEADGAKIDAKLERILEKLERLEARP